MLALILVAVVTVAPTPLPVRAFSLVTKPIDADAAMWIYQGTQGYGFAPVKMGTQERIDMLPPNTTAEQDTVGIELFRHAMDFQGYPMRISLVDKLFAASQKLNYIIAPTADSTRQYDPSKPAYEEQVLHGAGAGAFTASGPFPASGTILDQYKPAFTYAVSVLNTLDLPLTQKYLGNYGVMFIDTPTITWVELGPVFGPGETPHLGCQTALGRDMVFGFPKDASGSVRAGRFISCF